MTQNTPYKEQIEDLVESAIIFFEDYEELRKQWKTTEEVTNE